MAEGLSNNLRTQLLKWMGGESSITVPKITHIGLSTADPGATGSANAEPTVSTGGYARQTVSWATVVAPSGDAVGMLISSADVEFTATAPYSTGATQITHVTFWNDATATASTNYVGRAELADPAAMNSNGSQIKLLAGNLIINAAILS
jgi:hypothetical protein